jgi:polyisoprenoid-binding protein YceI
MNVASSVSRSSTGVSRPCDAWFPYGGFRGGPLTEAPAVRSNERQVLLLPRSASCFAIAGLLLLVPAATARGAPGLDPDFGFQSGTPSASHGAASGRAGEAGARSALPWQLTLDSEATELRFQLGATLHTVRGSFDVREGRVRFDPESGAVEGRVVVAATSGESGNSTRDANMHEEVLESAQYPEIVLLPERLAIDERTPDSLRGRLQARIEIHGGTHPVEIALTARRTAEGRGRVEGAFEIPFVEWGMTDPSNFVLRVEKVVAVRFEASGELTRRSLGSQHGSALHGGGTDSWSMLAASGPALDR